MNPTEARLEERLESAVDIVVREAQDVVASAPEANNDNPRRRCSSHKAAVIGVCVFFAGCALRGAQLLPAGATVCGEPRPQMCTMDYDPVCGLRRAAADRTYGNACGACADRDVVAHVPGACDD